MEATTISPLRALVLVNTSVTFMALLLMHYTNEQLIIFFAFIPNLVAAIVGVVKIRQIMKPLKILCLSIFFALAIEISSRIPWLLTSSNLHLWPIYITVEFGLLLWMFSLELNYKVLDQSRIGLIIGFIVLVLIETFANLGRLMTIQNIGRLIESLIIISLCIIYYYKTFHEQKVQDLLQEPFFWVASGLLIFFAGNFLIYVFINFILLYSKRFNIQIWLIHAFLSCLLYSAYTVALWIDPKS